MDRIWNASEQHLSAVYDLRSDNSYGLMNGYSTGTFGRQGNEYGWGVEEADTIPAPVPPTWDGSPCTYIKVNQGAFESDRMYTQIPPQPDPYGWTTTAVALVQTGVPKPAGVTPPAASYTPSYGNGFIYKWPHEEEILYCTVGPKGTTENDFKTVIVMGVKPGAQVGGSMYAFEELALYSFGEDISEYVGPGKRYWIHGEKDNHIRKVTQAGSWTEPAGTADFKGRCFVTLRAVPPFLACSSFGPARFMSRYQVHSGRTLLRRCHGQGFSTFFLSLGGRAA